MRGTRRKTPTFGALLAVLTVACSSTGVGHGPSVSPPPRDDVSPTATVTPDPSASISPGPASPLENGIANLVVSGDLTLDLTLPRLESPAVWSPPPAPMDITWLGVSGGELTLAGTSFVTLAETSGDRALSFTITGQDGPIVFTSTGGECSVTITPALPDNMGGVFTCTLLTDVEGGATVDARGTFAAAG